MKLALFDIKEHLLVNDMSERELIDSLKIISSNFTGRRDRIGEYIKDEHLVSAYASFYLPTNIPKFNFIFDQLGESVRDFISESDFYDIGSGPGTYSLAYLERTKSSHSIFAIDKSDLMLKQAKSLMDNLYPGFDNIHYINTIPKKEGKKTFFFGNSVNEIGAKKTFKMIEEHSPEVVFFIEPGTKEVFSEVNELRKNLLKNGYDVLYPCRGNAECPVEKKWKEKKSDWCHQVLRMTHDMSIERLGQLSQLDRKAMPLIGHVYIKKSLNLQGPSSARLFRFLQETKFSFEWELCDEREGKLELFKVEVQKKSLSKKQVKEFKKQSVGLAVQYEVLKELKPGYFRIKVRDIS